MCETPPPHPHTPQPASPSSLIKRDKYEDGALHLTWKYDHTMIETRNETTSAETVLQSLYSNGQNYKHVIIIALEKGQILHLLDPPCLSLSLSFMTS